MVAFSLTEEQRAFQEMAHDFAAREIRPIARECDREARMPIELIAAAHELGLMNTHIPERFGGLGLGFLDEALIAEELGWGCAGIGTSLIVNGLACTPLLLAGSEALQAEYLGRLVEEPRLASFCLTEPDAGSDAAGMRTTAVRDGDGYVISGSKCFITNGGYADWYVVFASTDRNAGARGISAFLVPRDETVLVDKKEDKMGQRASNTVTVTFDGTHIPAGHLLGAEGKGFKLAMMTLDRSRTGIAALSVGVGRAALEHARDYSLERRQFGGPISNLQAISFMLAGMATKVQAARLLTWQACSLLDEAVPASKISAMAKRFAADTAMEVTTEAVQIHGGYGYSREYPVEKLMRDAKLLQIYEGTSQVQQVVIARELLAGR